MRHQSCSAVFTSGPWGVQGDDGQVTLQGAALRQVGFRVWAHVGFGQNQHRLDARGGAQDQIPLQPRRVEIGVATGGDQGGVDIGRDQLAGHRGACGFALQQGVAAQDAQRHLAPGKNPVADGHIGGVHVRGRDQVVGTLGAQRFQSAAMHAGDAGGEGRVKFGQIHLGHEVVGPAKRGQRDIVQQGVILA